MIGLYLALGMTIFLFLLIDSLNGSAREQVKSVIVISTLILIIVIIYKFGWIHIIYSIITMWVFSFISSFFIKIR